MMSPIMGVSEPCVGHQLSADLEGDSSDASPRTPRVPKRRRLSSDAEGSFWLDADDSVRVQAAIEASLKQDVKRRMISSLHETRVDLESTYPEETRDGTFRRARERASSELSDFVRSREATPSMGPSRAPASPCMSFQSLPPAGSGPSSRIASPSLGPALPPTIEEAVDAGRFGDVEFELKVSDMVDSMYQHDGLVDHEELMRAIYASQGLDFEEFQGKAQAFLQEIGLRPQDMGVRNVDENGITLYNQCFYLSIARGYLGHECSENEVSELALRLKRAIEASVLAARPEWAVSDTPGNEAMAFADFLPIAMKANQGEEADLGVLAELAVCILDSTTGAVEVFLGSNYGSLQDETQKQANLVLLWYTPGHYKCLVNDDEVGTKVKMSYDNFKELLAAHGVQYIETLE